MHFRLAAASKAPEYAIQDLRASSDLTGKEFSEYERGQERAQNRCARSGEMRGQRSLFELSRGLSSHVISGTDIVCGSMRAT